MMVLKVQVVPWSIPFDTHAMYPTVVQPKQMKVLELQAMPHKRQQLLKLPQ
jgi:hypothetical protein